MMGEMDHTSPLCMGCSAMLTWVTGLIFHDLSVFTAVGGSILTAVGLYRLGKEVVSYLRRTMARTDGDT